MDIKQTDLSSKKGLERRLSVLQALMDTYISNNKPDTNMLVPIRNLSEHGLIFSEIDGILDGLRRDGCFSSWRPGTKNYSIEGINHKELIRSYQVASRSKSSTKEAKLNFDGRKLTVNGYKFTPYQFALLRNLYPPKDYIKTTILIEKIRKFLLQRKRHKQAKVAVKSLVRSANERLLSLELPFKVVGKSKYGYRLEFS